MKEDFLHYIWQFQYFNKSDLRTTRSEVLSVTNQGFSHHNAGADFQQAKVHIDNIEWAGNVEIHINASDWEAHGHHGDKAYENVILHVVWNADKPIYRQDGSEIATLELQNRVDFSLIERFRLLQDCNDAIPCAQQFGKTQSVTKFTMLDKALMQRLERKADEILALHETHHSNWEEIAYQWISQHFGFKLNNAPFLQLAQNLPLKILQKHGNSLLQTEALIFGQSGLLTLADETEDSYLKELKREHKFLQHKYRLKEDQLEASQWKFLRLRPPNFPTIRLAQLAMLIFCQKSFFSKLIFSQEPEKLLNIFEISQSEYWQRHYHFNKPISRKMKGMGKSSQVVLLINSVAPLLVAYGKFKKNEIYIERAISLLENLPPESNKITREWKELGLEVKSAFDSQASLELYNNYCKQQRCLQCNIGVKLLNR